MTAAILLSGLDAIERPEPIMNFEFDIDKDKLETVKAKLIELQKGYCVEGEKPKIRMGEKKMLNGKLVKFIEAYSTSDYSYIAFLGMKIKERSN